jgi:hypothetical protein
MADEKTGWGITREKEARSMRMGMDMEATTATGIRDGVGGENGNGNRAESAGRLSPAAVAAAGAGTGSTGEPSAVSAPSSSPQQPTGITRLPRSGISWTMKLLPLDRRLWAVVGLGFFSTGVRRWRDRRAPVRHGKGVMKMATRARWFTFIRIHQGGQDEFRLMRV